MRDSILRVLLFSDGGMAPIAIIWMVLSGLVAISRHSRWVSLLWFPTILVSGVFSLGVVPIILSGGYGLLALPAWGVFPVSTILLSVARPTEPFGGAKWVIGSASFGVVALVLFFIPRPNRIALRLEILEGEKKPVTDTTFSTFIYHGIGGNDEVRLRTDGQGLTTLRVYHPESGFITFEDKTDPRRNRKIQFEPWGPSVGGPTNGYKFDGKDVIAGNSEQILTIFWADKRDKSQMRTEPMYWFRAYGNLESNPSTLVLNAETGKFADDGDLVFSVRIEPRLDRGAAEWQTTTEVSGRDGAMLQPAGQRFMDVAPDAGYVDRATFRLGPTDELRFAFYVRTKSGKYGVVAVEYTIYGSRPRLSWGVLFASVRYNPSGSRYVEFDHTKWLNRN